MKKSTLILIISTAIFFTSTLYLLFLNFQKPNKPLVETQLPTLFPTKAIDPTANWKTYTNDIYGFSFQYDNTKHLLETSGIGEEALRSFYKYYGLNIDSNLLILWKGLKTTSLPEESITMHFNADQLFSVQIFNNNLSPEEFVKKLCESEYGPNYLKNSGFKKININGQVLYYFNSGGIGQGTFNYVFFDKNKIVSFNTHEPSITYETNPEFAQILSTFKFTDTSSQKTPAVIPKGWKSGYYKSEYGNQQPFTIAYPSNWFFEGMVFRNFDYNNQNPSSNLRPEYVKCDVYDSSSAGSSGLFNIEDFATDIVEIARESDNSYKIIRGNEKLDIGESVATTYQLSTNGNILANVTCYAFSISEAKIVDQIVKTIRY